MFFVGACIHFYTERLITEGPTDGQRFKIVYLQRPRLFSIRAELTLRSARRSPPFSP